jgi:hypothetical protein
VVGVKAFLENFLLETFKFKYFNIGPFSVQPAMEVKLSISSSRRISFASDFKDIDLEVEELENERDNPTYRGRVSYINSDSDDDIDANYVNEENHIKYLMI